MERLADILLCVPTGIFLIILAIGMINVNVIGPLTLDAELHTGEVTFVAIVAIVYFMLGVVYTYETASGRYHFFGQR